MISPSMALLGYANPPQVRTTMSGRVRRLAAGALVLALAACGDAPEEGGGPAEAGPSVRISQPAAGARVAGGSVLVVLEALFIFLTMQ